MSISRRFVSLVWIFSKSEPFSDPERIRPSTSVKFSTLAKIESPIAPGVVTEILSSRNGEQDNPKSIKATPPRVSEILTAITFFPFLRYFERRCVIYMFLESEGNM